MDTLSTKRARVHQATDGAERLAALTELSSALCEYDSAEAVAVADQALALAEALGDGKAKAWALHHRGWAFSSLGRLDEALDSQLSARAQFELEGDMSGIANTLMAIGDLYGDVVFPFQLTCFLSRPEIDYSGGEFLLIEQLPRMQLRGDAIATDRGDLVIFPVSARPVRGRRGVLQASMRHGVSRVTRGSRFTLGVIFHDAR